MKVVPQDTVAREPVRARAGPMFLQFGTGTGKLQKLSLSLEREWKNQHFISIVSYGTGKSRCNLWENYIITKLQYSP